MTQSTHVQPFFFVSFHPAARSARPYSAFPATNDSVSQWAHVPHHAVNSAVIRPSVAPFFTRHHFLSAPARGSRAYADNKTRMRPRFASTAPCYSASRIRPDHARCIGIRLACRPLLCTSAASPASSWLHRHGFNQPRDKGGIASVCLGLCPVLSCQLKRRFGLFDRGVGRSKCVLILG